MISPIEREFLPICSVFPPMTEDEFSELKESIKLNGVLEPITVNEEGKIADGRHRYKACLEMGVIPRFETFKPVGNETLEQFVFIKNYHRRNLTIDQKCVAALEYKDLIKIPRGQTNKGRNQWTPQEERTGRLKDTHAFKVACREFKIGNNTLAKASFVKNHNKELFEKIKKGELRVSTAYQNTKNLLPKINRGYNSFQIKTEQKQIDEILYKDCPLPLENDPLYMFQDYLKSITNQGVTFYMKVEKGNYYAHFQKQGEPLKLWGKNELEHEFRRSVVLAAKEIKTIN